MNRSTYYNIPDGTNRGRGAHHAISSDTPHRDKSYAPWNSAAAARGEGYAALIGRLEGCCGRRPHKSKRNSSVLSDNSRPRHPETPTTHKLHRTHLSNDNRNDNHFRTGHACGSGTAQLVAAGPSCMLASCCAGRALVAVGPGFAVSFGRHVE